MKRSIYLATVSVFAIFWTFFLIGVFAEIIRANDDWISRLAIGGMVGAFLTIFTGVFIWWGVSIYRSWFPHPATGPFAEMARAVDEAFSDNPGQGKKPGKYVP